MQALKFGIGQSVTRKEDDPLLRGRGRYVADLAPRGTLHAAVVRSPHAHARFRIDAGKARTMPGVRLVLTAAETADLGPLPCPVEFPGVKLYKPPYPILTRDEVRHVGDAVAFVVADTLERAKDAAEAILDLACGAAAACDRRRRRAASLARHLVWPQAGAATSPSWLRSAMKGGDRSRLRGRGESFR